MPFWLKVKYIFQENNPEKHCWLQKISLQTPTFHENHMTSRPKLEKSPAKGEHLLVSYIFQTPLKSGWWFQPIWKILVKLEIFSK